LATGGEVQKRPSDLERHQREILELEVGVFWLNPSLMVPLESLYQLPPATVINITFLMSNVIKTKSFGTVVIKINMLFYIDINRFWIPSGYLTVVCHRIPILEISNKYKFNHPTTSPVRDKEAISKHCTLLSI
jgi:hypothetical protein